MDGVQTNKSIEKRIEEDANLSPLKLLQVMKLLRTRFDGVIEFLCCLGRASDFVNLLDVGTWSK